MIITLRNIYVYAYHGCLKEEAIIGGNYKVDVKIRSDFSDALLTDDLNKTVDYCQVFEIVKREMAIRSKLIEHVAGRIADALIDKIARIEQVKVRVIKMAPPMNGDVERVEVVVIKSRL